MASGYCRACDRFVKFEQRIARVRTRAGGVKNELRYYPVPHPKLGDDTGGTDCDGVALVH